MLDRSVFSQYTNWVGDLATGNPGQSLANTQVGMATCPPLLVDDVVGRIRPPDPRCASAARREGTVEGPESAWTSGNAPGPTGRDTRLRPLRTGAGR